MSRFYAKVLVPLSGDGWFQIEAELPDFDAVQADEMAVVRSALRQAFEFALGHEDAQAVEEHDLEEAPAQPAPEPPEDPIPALTSDLLERTATGPRPAPSFPVDMVKCPECEREFVPSGLKVHMTRAHAPERRCAEEGCGTVLSRYNKGDRCGQHEGLRVG